MDTETLGEPRLTDADALYAQAKQSLGDSANRLRALTTRLRELYTGDDDAWYQEEHRARRDATTTPERDAALTQEHARLARLDLAARELEEIWRFLERGLAGEWVATGRTFADTLQVDEAREASDATRIIEAQEQERGRLAEELHDGPAQALANAVFKTEVIDRALRIEPATARSQLQELRAILEREVERMRAYIHELRPALEESDGLAAALGDAARQLVDETGMNVSVDLAAPETMLDLPRRTAVLRIALEAIRNVRKHSGAARAYVSTRLEPSPDGGTRASWVLEVRDDGRGFIVDDAVAGTIRRHFGLRFMRERAQLVGAALEIVSDPAGGTTVRLRLDPRERS